MSEQSVCCGCLLNPGFIQTPFFQNPATSPVLTPFTVNCEHLRQQHLTSEERELLLKLGECWNSFIALDKRSSADNQEFMDAIHRCQQLVALGVARRIDPEVWTQPE